MLARNISLNGLLFLLYCTFFLIFFSYFKSLEKLLLFIVRGNEKIAGWIFLFISGVISIYLARKTGEPIADFIEAIFGFRFRGS